MSLIHEVSDIFQNQKFPKKWITIELNKVLKIQNGFAFKSSNFNSDGIGMPLIRIRDIKNSTMETFYDGIILEDFIVTEGDLIIGMDGDFNSNFWKGSPALLNQRVCRLIPDENFILKKLLYYGLPNYLNKINENTSSTTVKHLSSKSIGEIPFPLPPLAEQNRIVAKLDTLFAQLEIIKASMAKIPVLLKEFRQQVLTQAVIGKLTEEWRKGKELESAEVLIHKIIQKRVQDFDLKCQLAKENGERKPTKVLLDKLPKIERINVDLPEKWFQTNVHFLSFVTKLAGFEYSLHFDLKEEGEIPVVRAQNVQMGRFEDKNRLYMSEETSDFLVRSQLHGREILMVFIGAGTGNVCLAPKDERWHLAPNVAKIDVDGISTEYLYLYLQSALGIENVLSRVKATAQPSLSMETIRDIVALVPPLEEQYEIVSRVESLFAKADAIEQQYLSVKEKIDNLPQALLHKAFKGELTEQLESDGDARELLQQIQELKNSTVKPKKATSKKVKKYPENETVLGMVAEGK